MGYSQHFAADIPVYHPARMSLQEHAQKAVRLGRGREQRFELDGRLPTGRPWYHLWNFAPHPLRFLNRLQVPCSVPLIILFYSIAYCLKLISVSGQLLERYPYSI
jgi:hypothetical protein